MGYQALYELWVQQANTALESRLDRDEYNDQELVTIAIPLHLPYLTDQAGFERLSGQTVFNGVTYQYVQRRVYHDSLYLQCLPNHEAMRLNTARNDCFQFTTDMQKNGSGVLKPVYAFTKHFTGSAAAIRVQQPVISSNCNQFFLTNQAILQPVIAAVPDQPPEVVI